MGSELEQQSGGLHPGPSQQGASAFQVLVYASTLPSAGLASYARLVGCSRLFLSMICLDFVCLDLLTLLFETIFEFLFLPPPLRTVGILGMSC